MVIRIGINGFGRIGRLATRLVMLKKKKEIEIVAINDLALSPEYMAYQFKYDSVHGLYPGQCSSEKDTLLIDDSRIAVYKCRHPESIPWSSHHVDVVLECTGVFRTLSSASKHIDGGGARFVVISAPSSDAPMFCMGTNTDSYDGESVVSNASCTTNCLAPLASVLHEQFGIVEGLMTTIHAATATQNPVDAPTRGSWRSGRSALSNIIPASTGAAKAVGKVIPSLSGKLTGMAFRVPTADVSIVDLTVKLASPASPSAVLRALKSASSSSRFSGVLSVSSDPVVSSDFTSDTRSCIVDSDASVFLSPTFMKLIAYYDNEFSYAFRLLELALFIASFPRSKL